MSRDRLRRCAAALLLSALPGSAAAAAEPVSQVSQAPQAYEVAAGLAGLGPRPDGSPAQQRAVALLLDALRRAGLRDVRAVPLRPPAPAGRAGAEPALFAVQGMIPGRGAGEIDLSAHFDSVAASPGADDDASGCGVAIAAAADLARTPLQHTVRVVLFDGEERGLLGSRAWVATLEAAGRDRILADLNLEMLGWPGSPGPTIHAFPMRTPEGVRVFPPGWLVHALLRGGTAVGWPLAMADPGHPLLMQLVQRSLAVSFGADSGAFLAHGVPALSLSDSSLLDLDPAYHKAADTAARLDPRRLGRWSEAVAAAVRRLDALAGRPVPEDQYLVLDGSVWLRRDLAWVGFALWVALVFRGLPGRWRGAPPEERRRQSRRYLPAFAFRIFLLLAVFIAPLLAVLLFPAAALALLAPLWRSRPAARYLALALGLLPLAVYTLALAVAVARHLVTLRGGFQAGPFALFLLLGAAVTWATSLLAAPRRAGLERL